MGLKDLRELDKQISVDAQDAPLVVRDHRLRDAHYGAELLLGDPSFLPDPYDPFPDALGHSGPSGLGQGALSRL